MGHSNKEDYNRKAIGNNKGICEYKEWWEGTFKNKLPTLSKKDKANGKKIKQVV